MNPLQQKQAAAQLLQNQKFPEALQACQRYLKKHKKDAEGHHLLGSIYGAMNDMDQAIIAFKKAIKLQAKNPQLHFNLSVALQKMEDLQGAKKSLENTIKLSPNFFEAYSNLTEILWKLDLTDEARVICERAIEINPNHAPIHLSMGNILRLKKEFEKAKQEYETCIKINPNFDEVHVDYGLLYITQNDSEKAEVSFNRALQLNPGNSRANMQLGLLKHKQLQFDECIELLRKAITNDMRNEVAHYNLAVVYKQKEKFNEAINHLNAAIQIKPNYVEAYFELATAYREIGALDKALDALEAGREYNKDNVEYYMILGSIRGARGDLHGGVDALKEGIKLDPGSPRLYLNLGLAYNNANQYDLALEAFEQSLNLAGDDSYSEENSIAGKAMILERRKQPQESYDLIKPYIKENTSSRIALTLGKLSKKLGLFDNAVKVMEQALNEPDATMDSKIELHFQLGKMYDNKDFFDKAFEHYKAGNEYFRLYNSDLIKRYTNQENIDYFDKISSFFSKQFFENAVTSQLDSELPVFIVGMPRSGTTLTETILSNHANVFGAGELQDIPNIRRQSEEDTDAGFPANLNNISSGSLAKYASSHLETLKQKAPNATRVVDKMPHNFLLIGLISVLYPKAKIIHIQRYPVDNCLSIYFQRFNISHTYASDLVGLGEYYRLYMDIMKHWNEVLPGKILNIKYDELVTKQEQISREMIHFCGLDWDDNCLQFHKSKRDVGTPSYDQVSQPMYTKSSGRWTNYEQHIQPLINTLKENGCIDEF